VPPEALVALRRRLDTLPARHPDRTTIVEQAAALYGVSAITLYRQLRSLHRPQPVRRADRGQPRKVSAAELERVGANSSPHSNCARPIKKDAIFRPRAPSNLWSAMASRRPPDWCDYRPAY
jgi:hypothetical protein